MTYNKFIKHVAGVAIANLIIAIQGILLIPIITKHLGAQDYGIWIQLMLIVALLVPLSMLGLNTAVVRFLAGEKDKEKIADGFFSSTFVIALLSLILALFTLLLSDPISFYLFNDSSLSNLIKFTGAILVVQSLNQMGLCIFRTFRRIKTYSILTVFQHLGELLLLAYIVLSGYDLLVMLLSILILRTAFTLIIFFIIVSNIGFTLPHFYNTRAYLSYSLPLMFVFSFAFIISSSDHFVIGFLLGPTSVGVYSVSYSISSIISLMWFPVAFIMFPTITKLWEENDIEGVKSYFKRVFKFFSILAIPIIFGLSILSKQIILLLSTQEFVPSYNLISIIGAGYFFDICIVRIGEYILALLKKTKVTGLLYIFFGFFNLVFTFLFVTQVGILGAAIATFLTYFFLGLSLLYIAFKYVFIDLDLFSIMKSIGAAIIMSVSIWMYNPIGVMAVFLSILVGAIVYFVFLLLLNTFNKDEILFLKNNLQELPLIPFLLEGYLTYSKKTDTIQRLLKRHK